MDDTGNQFEDKSEMQIEINKDYQINNNIELLTENKEVQQIKDETKQNISNKVIKIIVSITPLICAFSIQIIVIFVFAMFCYITPIIKLIAGIIDLSTFDEKILNITPDWLLLTILGATICIPFFALWYWYEIKNENSKNNIKSLIKNINNNITIKNIFFIMILGIALEIGIYFILYFIEWLQPEWFVKYNKMMKIITDRTSLLTILYSGLIAPISEELICRGVILSYSKKALPFMYANILQALLFGIYHGNIVQGSYAFIFGLFLGFLCLKFKSIIAPIILHMTVNLSGEILGLALKHQIFSTTITKIIMFIISLIVATISTIYFKNMKNVSFEEEGDLVIN